jgi:hypothetical protein
MAWGGTIRSTCFFDSWEFTNSPGGISNGITSGFRDEEGIDYDLKHTETGADNDWCWQEQWLPHASWFLDGRVGAGEREEAVSAELTCDYSTLRRRNFRVAVRPAKLAWTNTEASGSADSSNSTFISA